MTINHTDLLTRNDLVKVNCIVEEPVGVPFFSLRYHEKGSKNISKSTEWNPVRNYPQDHQWIYTTVLHVTDEGTIICRVTDMVGRYTKLKYIRIAGMLFIEKERR